MLNIIDRFNADTILDITEKIYSISKDKHWEIKAQCLEFAITILDSYRNMSHLLTTTNKDDMKTQKATDDRNVQSPKGAAGGPAKGDTGSVKCNLNMSVDIVNNCFNLNAPKSVQKIGLFKL